MKKIYILSFIALAAIIFQNCSTPKGAMSKKASKVTYANNIQAVMVKNCSPCHFPPEGNKKPYNTYATVSASIDSIVNRINRNPGQKGFMPARHPKLADSTINLFVQWKAGGLKEK